MSYNPLLLYFYVFIQLVCYIQQYGFQIIFQLKILVLAHKPCLREVASLSLWIFEDAMKQSCLPYVLNTDVHIQSSRYPSVLEH